MKRFGTLLLVLILAVPAFAEDPAIRLPDLPRPPSPPQPSPSTIQRITPDVLYVFDSDVECLVTTSALGHLSVTSEAGPLRIRGRFVDNPTVVTTKTFAGKRVFTVEPVKTGRVELIIVPPGAKAEADIIRRTLDAVVGPVPPEPTPVPPGLPSLSLGSISVNEGNVGPFPATLTATLSKVSETPVTVAYETHDGTATAGQDYTTTTGTLTFAPGETSKSFTVIVTGDTIQEPDETVTVHLHNPTNATLGMGEATITIRNDDASPPAPIPGEGLRVLMVYQDSDTTKYPKEQMSILSHGGGIREYLNSKCVKVGNTPEWRVWDVDVNVSNESPIWQAAWKRERKETPWIIISNPAMGGGYEGPLPKTIAETMALLKKFGGP